MIVTCDRGVTYYTSHVRRGRVWSRCVCDLVTYSTSTCDLIVVYCVLFVICVLVGVIVFCVRGVCVCV